MGMYDQIRFVSAMPDGFQTQDYFQTKNLERLLVDYEVDSNGQLWEIGIGEEPSPDGAQKLSLTGVIECYTSVDDPGQDKNKRLNYVAIFQNGILQHIREGQIDAEEPRWAKFPKASSIVPIRVTHNPGYDNIPYVRYDDIPNEYHAHIGQCADGSGCPAPPDEPKVCFYLGDVERWLRLLGVHVEFFPLPAPKVASL